MRATITKSHDARRDERFATTGSAEVEAIGDEVYPAAMLDVSHHGFRAVVDGPLAVESLVRLKIGDYSSLLARIVWTNGALLGGEFIEAISRTAMVAILRRRLSDRCSTVELTLDGEP